MLLRTSGSEYALLIFFVVVIAIVPYIFFLLTLQRTLKQVNPVNLHMKPDQVWLMFIPIFNYLWVFWLIAGVADSIEDELRARRMPPPLHRPGYNVGLGYAICLCVALVLRFIPYMNVIASFAGLVGLILWIIYWVQISNWKTVLITNNAMYVAQQDPLLENQPPPQQHMYNPVYGQQQYYAPPQQPYTNQPPVYPPQYGYQQPNYQQPPPQDQPPPADNNDISRWMPPGHQDPPAQ